MQIKISNWKVKLSEHIWSWSQSQSHSLLNRSGAGASKNFSAPGPCLNVRKFEDKKVKDKMIYIGKSEEKSYQNQSCGQNKNHEFPTEMINLVRMCGKSNTN